MYTLKKPDSFIVELTATASDIKGPVSNAAEFVFLNFSKPSQASDPKARKLVRQHVRRRYRQEQAQMKAIKYAGKRHGDQIVPSEISSDVSPRAAFSELLDQSPRFDRNRDYGSNLYVCPNSTYA
jgi:hypothetical protein